MDIKRYDVVQLNRTKYKFFSAGGQGKIEIWVIFTFMGGDSYNLGFGVWDANAEQMDDLIQIRNGDMNQILATVAYTVFDFLQDNPKAYIFATGSSAARTRKYQMGIGQNLEYLLNRYHIFGLKADRDLGQNFIGEYPDWEGEWIEFQMGGRYDAFLMYLK
ncbi:DUF6934 family protein [Dyadobacter sp. CY323]|uniref:DUF6934 family protein n=1 Tax=Dyadobacter sp. CY323 TaxID=2907302 RepID=UPI001F23D03B|nr:hypothetical protein [Dyadobacter sp. CY323]MCE6991735.1 hypothetical protein [Dyadobacter sp. CY323]